MKLTTLFFSILVLPAAQAASVIINFSLDTQSSNQLDHTAEVPNGTTFSTQNIVGVSPISIGDNRGALGTFTLTETIGATTFTGTFDLSLEINTSNPAVGPANAIQRGGVGALGVLAGNGFQGAGQSATFSNIVLTHVSGDDVFQFDGFSGAFFGAVTSGEIGTINGVEVTPNSSNNTSIQIADLISFTPVSTVTITGGLNAEGTANGQITVEGLQAEFSVIPEPSSLALLGLCGLAFLRRRR